MFMGPFRFLDERKGSPAGPIPAGQEEAAPQAVGPDTDPLFSPSEAVMVTPVSCPDPRLKRIPKLAFALSGQRPPFRKNPATSTIKA